MPAYFSSFLLFPYLCHLFLASRCNIFFLFVQNLVLDPASMILVLPGLSQLGESSFLSGGNNYEAIKTALEQWSYIIYGYLLPGINQREVIAKSAPGLSSLFHNFVNIRHTMDRRRAGNERR